MGFLNKFKMPITGTVLDVLPATNQQDPTPEDSKGAHQSDSVERSEDVHDPQEEDPDEHPSLDTEHVAPESSYGENPTPYSPAPRDPGMNAPVETPENEPHSDPGELTIKTADSVQPGNVGTLLPPMMNDLDSDTRDNDKSIDKNEGFPTPSGDYDTRPEKENAQGPDEKAESHEVKGAHISDENTIDNTSALNELDASDGAGESDGSEMTVPLAPRRLKIESHYLNDYRSESLRPAAVLATGGDTVSPVLLEDVSDFETGKNQEVSVVGNVEGSGEESEYFESDSKEHVAATSGLVENSNRSGSTRVEFLKSDSETSLEGEAASASVKVDSTSVDSRSIEEKVVEEDGVVEGAGKDSHQLGKAVPVGLSSEMFGAVSGSGNVIPEGLVKIHLDESIGERDFGSEN